jgi:hypothetical protein
VAKNQIFKDFAKFNSNIYSLNMLPLDNFLFLRVYFILERERERERESK